jgi:predicted dehydrogenase
MSAPPPFRCLIVGYGFRGKQWAETAASRRDISIAGVVDSQADALEAASARGLVGWRSLDEALATADIDGAVIASPPALHADHAVACLSRRVRVLVEKPLATSVAEAQRSAEASEMAGTLGLVAQNFRFRRRELAVRRALADPRVGTLRGATVVSARPSQVMRDSTRSLPHAPLWDIGIHHLDLLRSRFGSAPGSVAASCRRDRFTTYTLELQWEGAESVVYRLTEGTPNFGHVEWLQGDRGAVQAAGGAVHIIEPGRRPRRVRSPRAPRPRDLLLARLAGSDESGEREQPGLRDNIETIAMVEAAVASLVADGHVATREVVVA